MNVQHDIAQYVKFQLLVVAVIAAMADSTYGQSPGSTITLVDSETSIPNLVLDNSTLQTAFGASRETFELTSEIELINQSTIQVTSDDVLWIQGGIAGSGSVIFKERFDSSAPSPSPRTAVRIFGPTSYQGETVIGPNVRVEFLDAAVLGDSQVGTLVDRGFLVLAGGGGNESIVVDHGLLRLSQAETAYTHNVVLRSGAINGGDSLTAVLATRVNYSQGALLGTESSSDNLVLAGGISGTGSLSMHNDVTIAGSANVRGNLVIENRAGAILSEPLNLTGKVLIDAAHLRLTGDIQASETRFYIGAQAETASASLATTVSNTIKSVVLDPRQSNSDTTFDRLELVASEGAILTVADELRFLGGTIRGRILGQETLIKQTNAIGILDNTAGSSFQHVDIEGGQFVVRGNIGSNAPDLVLRPSDTGRILLENTGNYTGEIDLNNAVGYDGQAALTLSGDTTFNGVVHLGERGATISSDSRTGVSIGPDASIRGQGDFVAVGGKPLLIYGDNHTYTGQTRIHADSVLLIDGGRLSSTGAIVGACRLGSTGGRPTLVLDNSSVEALADRIPDATPVQTNGMRFTLIGRDGEAVAETVGMLDLGRGTTEIVVENPTSVGSSTKLTLNEFRRPSGSMVSFHPNNASAGIFFAEAPELHNGLIGGFALFGDGDFATYDATNGVVAYSDVLSYVADLDAAGIDDNISLMSGNGDIQLARDTQVNAIRLDPITVNLGDNRLTIISGGLIGRSTTSAIITGGELTAGSHAGAELFVAGNIAIESDIVDNEQGAVGLTVSPNVATEARRLLLSGSNTYSGPTTVNSRDSVGILELASENALPAGSDVFLNGGDLRVNHQRTAPLQIGRLEIRDFGDISSTDGFTPLIEPESILIESGNVSLDIIGDAPITKVSRDIAAFREYLRSHTGPIFIKEGTLEVSQLGAVPIDDDHAVTISRGGRLYLPHYRSSISARKFRLEGGVIETLRDEGITGPIEVTALGGTIRNLSNQITPKIDGQITGEGLLVVESADGRGILQFDADLRQFKGHLRLAGVNIDLGAPLSDYSGDIEIAAAGASIQDGVTLVSPRLIVLPEGRVNISGRSDVNLSLEGGAINLKPGNEQRPSFLAGNLSVKDESFLFLTPRFGDTPGEAFITADIALQDGSHLTVAETPIAPKTVKRGLFSDRVTVQTNLTVFGSTRVTSLDHVITLAGVIAPGSANAVLDFVGNETFSLSSSIQLEDGHSLTIREDGQPRTLAISGLRIQGFLAGSGLIRANVNLLNRSLLSPGDSAGELVVDGDIELHSNSTYNWEIGNGDGEAGVDWDVLRVTGDLVFEASIARPWKLQLSDLPDFALGENLTWQIAQADRIIGFSPDTASIILSDIQDADPLFSTKSLALFVNNGGLFLSVVPEPSSLLMLLLASIAFSMQRTGRK